MSCRDQWMTVLLIRKNRGSWQVPVRSGIITIRVENLSTNVKIKFNNLCLTTIPGRILILFFSLVVQSKATLLLSYTISKCAFFILIQLTFSMHLSLILNANTGCPKKFWPKISKCHKGKLFEIYSKCRIWIFLILAFSTNFCPIRTDLSGNTVWPQASGFQKLAKIDHFCHF